MSIDLLNDACEELYLFTTGTKACQVHAGHTGSPRCKSHKSDTWRELLLQATAALSDSSGRSSHTMGEAVKDESFLFARHRLSQTPLLSGYHRLPHPDFNCFYGKCLLKRLVYFFSFTLFSSLQPQGTDHSRRTDQVAKASLATHLTPPQQYSCVFQSLLYSAVSIHRLWPRAIQTPSNQLLN